MNLREYQAIKRVIDKIMLAVDYLPEKCYNDLVEALGPVEDILNSYPHYERPELGYRRKEVR